MAEGHWATVNGHPVFITEKGGTTVVAKPSGKRKPPEKGSPEWHRYRIAKKTLKMDDAAVGVMGGPSKEEARAYLAQFSR